jgi:predicted transcriptional regulator
MYPVHRISISDMKTSSITPLLTYILKKTSDDKTLTLFNSIATSDGDRNIPLKEMSLTPKQYYSRISGLLTAGLIRRQRGKYALTLLGKVVYDTHLNIGKALSYYWKLKAIESIDISSPDTRLPIEELIQLINTLIDNHFIRDFLIRESLLHVPKDTNRAG